MSLKRKEFHKLIDEQLDKYGYGDEIDISWGKLTTEVSFQNEKVTVVLKERETAVPKLPKSP
jgi:hypothetical protein